MPSAEAELGRPPELSGSQHTNTWHQCAAWAPAHEREDDVRLRWAGKGDLGHLGDGGLSSLSGG